jgi:hypothetical protein
MDTADMKNDTSVTTDASAQVPVDLSHVAETGRHQARTVTSVIIQAIVARNMTV